MIDVTAFGEILIDFTPAGISPQGNTQFERNPGGAPANVAVCVARLGGKSAFIGKVGSDIFGHFLSAILDKNGVDVRGMRADKKTNTTLAFVQLDENGERSFSFYRNPGADMTLEADEVDFDLIRASKVFHYGSISLTDEPARSATLAAIRCAKESGCTVSYDPNLRPALWSSLDEAYRWIRSAAVHADILKLSEEELEFITGEKDLVKGTGLLHSEYKTPLILVTRGSQGSFYRMGEYTGFKPTFNSIKAVDTTGAGDSFLGGFLYYMLTHGCKRPGQMDIKILEQAIIFASAAASLCVTGKGAIPAMPDLKSVVKLIESEEL